MVAQRIYVTVMIMILIIIIATSRSESGFAVCYVVWSHIHCSSYVGGIPSFASLLPPSREGRRLRRRRCLLRRRPPPLCIYVCICDEFRDRNPCLYHVDIWPLYRVDGFGYSSLLPVSDAIIRPVKSSSSSTSLPAASTLRDLTLKAGLYSLARFGHATLGPLPLPLSFPR